MTHMIMVVKLIWESLKQLGRNISSALSKMVK